VRIPTGLSFSLAVMVMTAAAAHAAPLTATATDVADTFVDSASPTLNLGGAGAMQVATPTSPTEDLESTLRFDVSAAVSQFNTQFGAGQWTLTSAALNLGTNFGTQGQQPNNPIFASINAGNFIIGWMASDAWIEGTGTPAVTTPPTDGSLTYSNLPTYLSASDQSLGTFTYIPKGNVVSSWSLGLGSNFVSDVDAGGSVSLRLYAAPGSDVSYLFNARSFASNPPMLVLTADAVPEPASLGMLACGGLLLLSRRRVQR